MAIQAVGKYLYLEVEVVENTTASGIVLTTTSESPAYQRGVVVSLGDEAAEEGVAVGDTVIFYTRGIVSEVSRGFVFVKIEHVVSKVEV
jgi:co-chaperonin GroES (HSP10)